MKLIFVLIFIYNWSPWKEVPPYEKGCFTYRWKAETYDQKKLLDEQIPFPLRADEAHWDNWKNTSINAIKGTKIERYSWQKERHAISKTRDLHRQGMFDYRLRARWKLFYTCPKQETSVNWRYKGLQQAYCAENIYVDRWSVKLQRAKYRKKMHDQTEESQEVVWCS